MNAITTGVVRLSYAFLNEPREKSGKFETGIIIPKSDKATIAKIEDMLEKAYELGITKCWGGKKPKRDGKTFNWPLRDGDVDKEDDDPAYVNAMFLTAKTNRKPYVLDRSKNIITDPNEVYSGMYAYVVISAFPYDNESKGVSISLEAIQKVRDGDPLGGSSLSYEQAANMFDSFSDDEAQSAAPDDEAAGGGFL